jgi:hypothetical protein
LLARRTSIALGLDDIEANRIKAGQVAPALGERGPEANEGNEVDAVLEKKQAMFERMRGLRATSSRKIGVKAGGGGMPLALGHRVSPGPVTVDDASFISGKIAVAAAMARLGFGDSTRLEDLSEEDYRAVSASVADDGHDMDALGFGYFDVHFADLTMEDDLSVDLDIVDVKTLNAEDSLATDRTGTKHHRSSRRHSHKKRLTKAKKKAHITEYFKNLGVDDLNSHGGMSEADILAVKFLAKKKARHVKEAAALHHIGGSDSDDDDDDDDEDDDKSVSEPSLSSDLSFSESSSDDSESSLETDLSYAEKKAIAEKNMKKSVNGNSAGGEHHHHRHHKKPITDAEKARWAKRQSHWSRIHNLSSSESSYSSGIRSDSDDVDDSSVNTAK